MILYMLFNSFEPKKTKKKKSIFKENYKTRTGTRKLERDNNIN